MPWRLTLGETFFVAVLLLFAVAVIPPVLFRVKSGPLGPTCGSNLSGLGKAMLIYANDYEDRLPVAGGPDASWAARTPNWKGKDRAEAYGVLPEAAGGQASISASLYLLVKYEQVRPTAFLCRDRKGNIEKGARVFDPCEYGVQDRALTDLWDFGPNPPEHVSFAYHMGYGPYTLTTDSSPGMAVAADRNPWMDSPLARARDFTAFTPDLPPFDGTQEAGLRGNSLAHKGLGQNVLFLDSHVDLKRRPFCGIKNDNIYTSWDGEDRIRGKPAQFGSVPAGPEDSLLVNDPTVAATVPYPDWRQ
jgi:hypothetical protein